MKKFNEAVDKVKSREQAEFYRLSGEPPYQGLADELKQDGQPEWEAESLFRAYPAKPEDHPGMANKSACVQSLGLYLHTWGGESLEETAVVDTP